MGRTVYVLIHEWLSFYGFHVGKCTVRLMDASWECHMLSNVHLFAITSYKTSREATLLKISISNSSNLTFFRQVKHRWFTGSPAEHSPRGVASHHCNWETDPWLFEHEGPNSHDPGGQ